MLEHFKTHGWVRVPAAFSAEDAAAMRDVTWRALEAGGIKRDDPSTWTQHRPFHLQHLKKDPVFKAVGTQRTCDAISEVLGTTWRKPKDWGAFFIVFPTPGREWSCASEGWHIDADYTGELDPAFSVKVHAMYGDVEPHAGGMNIMEGSHRVVHEWFRRHPPEPGVRAAKLRKQLLRDAPLADLPIRENTAQAGDVIIMHSLLLHAPPAAHCGTQPRFLLNTEIAR